MIYALIMLISLMSLAAFWRGSRAGLPLFLFAAVAMAAAFVMDITHPLTISL